MKPYRFSLAALTLLTVLAVSGGCFKHNIPTNSLNKNIKSAEVITEAPQIMKNRIETQETTDVPVPSSSTNLYPAYEYVNGEKQYGFIDENGIFIIQPGYSYVTDFKDGYAVITASRDYKVIDQSGSIIYESDYLIKPYSNGAAVFSKLSGSTFKEGYIDTNGNVIIDPVYLQADDFKKDNTALVETDIGNYALINKSGNVLETYQLDKKYNSVVDFKNGYIIYSGDKDGKVGVVTYKGEEIFKPIYNEIKYLGDDLFAIKDPSLDSNGTLTTEPAAIFDKTGKQLTDYVFYDLSEFHNGYASATNSQYTYFVDKKGKEAISLPKMEGRGTLTLFGDIIKAEIDDDLVYMRKDGTVVWQNDRTQTLSPEITVKELKFKPNKYVYVYYPNIEGFKNETLQASVNGRLYKLFTDPRANSKEEDKTSIADTFSAELRKDLLIINKTGYDYPFGAAHGMPSSDYYFIDINTGEFYDLSDLFKENTDYAKKINEIINTKIQEQSKSEDSFIFPDSFKGISENQYFKLTEDSLVIYFYPYEIAPYAAGFPEFEISFEQLHDIIDYDGNFWKSFQDKTVN
ncbi:WG repeat-containing protein [Anaerocolumna sp. MB42-C2]|uniref:WG repeat-containing protein n=1 Tax=Anaerocolumna sp. MB42-C2 TaxID=3070997 RepID=UPI0027DF4A9D|nr:DUF3298 domain-containing protein [Anaerocolumna sp. MB42-C2]WMJ88944.1 DUF3298 domain-containing protein [Anaerocolumna sp. MB42-C2]